MSRPSGNTPSENLPAPPKEIGLIRSEIQVAFTSRATLSLLALALVAESYPLISFGGEIYWPVRLALWIFLVASLWYQANILMKHRSTRRLRRWRNWRQQRFLLLRERVENLSANRADRLRERMPELLVARGRLIILHEGQSPVLKQNELDYQLEFDRLAEMALDALKESDNAEPLEQVLTLAGELEQEIPAAIADSWQAPAFDQEEFNRKLEGLRSEHVVRVGVTRRGLEARKD